MSASDEQKVKQARTNLHKSQATSAKHFIPSRSSSLPPSLPSSASLASLGVHRHSLSPLLPPSSLLAITSLVDSLLPLSPSQPDCYAQATTDVEVCKHPSLRSLVLPLIPSITSLVTLHTCSNTPPSCFDDVFIVKYSAGSQNSLVRHVDAGDFSFMVALSSPAGYEGGGTSFDGVPDPVICEAGEVLLFPSDIYHSGLPLTSGTRHLLVGFCHLSPLALRTPLNVSLSLEELRGVRSRIEVMRVEREGGERLEEVGREVGERMEEGRSYWCKIGEGEERGGGGGGGGEEAASAIETFVRFLFFSHCKRLSLTVDPLVSGVEFWASSSSDPKDTMPYHYDKDEALLKSSGETAHPAVATVTYLEDCIQLPTVVFGEEETIVSFPRRGNHLCFAGSLLHGCPGALLRPPREAREGEAGRRMTLMVNVWSRRAPLMEGMGTLGKKNKKGGEKGKKKEKRDKKEKKEKKRRRIQTEQAEWALSPAGWKEITVDVATVYSAPGSKEVVVDPDELFREENFDRNAMLLDGEGGEEKEGTGRSDVYVLVS